MSTVFSVVYASGVALLVLLTGPILVGAYVEVLGLSEQVAGLVFSLEMTGFTCGALLMFAALSRSQRQVLLFSVGLLVAGNVLATIADAPMLLAGCRFLAGIGSGMLMTLTILVVGTMRNTDVVYGLWTVGQLVLGAAGLLLFPWVIATHGLAAVFLVISLLAASLFATVRWYPASPSDQKQPAETARTSRSWVGLVCLAGVFVYYAGQAAVWVYLERVGVNWGLQPGAIANILFVGLLFGILGAAIAVFLGDRAGRRIPVSASLTISAIAIAMFIVAGGSARYAAAACLFNLAWYLFLPYSASVVASVDRDGKLLTGLGVIFPASLAAGPAFAALFVSNGELLGPLMVGLFSIPIGLAAILPATRR